MNTVAPFLRRSAAPLSTGDAVQPAAATPPQLILAGDGRRGAPETISTSSVARGLMYRELPRGLMVQAATQIKKKNVDKQDFFIHSLCSVFPVPSHTSKTDYPNYLFIRCFLGQAGCQRGGENPHSHLICLIDFCPLYSFDLDQL
jgi:hypothetical protein